MGRQQVNLYTLEFRRHEQPLSSRTLIRSCLGLLILLALVEAFAAWGFLADRKRLEVLQQEEQQVASRLQTLRASRPFSQGQELEEDIASLRREIHRRSELQALISGQNLGNTAGFSPFMEAMARQSSEDLSLTRIRLLKGGEVLELDGWTRKADSVPFYLQRLRGEKAFEKAKFGVLGIREQEKPKLLQFSLGRPEGSS